MWLMYQNCFYVPIKLAKSWLECGHEIRRLLLGGSPEDLPRVRAEAYRSFAKARPLIGRARCL